MVTVLRSIVGGPLARTSPGSPPSCWGRVLTRTSAEQHVVSSPTWIGGCCPRDLGGVKDLLAGTAATYLPSVAWRRRRSRVYARGTGFHREPGPR